MASAVAGAGLGTAPPAIQVNPQVGPAGGGDQRGVILFGSGSATPAGGVTMTVTLNQSFNQPPNVTIEPDNAVTDALAGDWGILNVTNNSFQIYFNGTITASQAAGTFALEYNCTINQPE